MSTVLICLFCLPFLLLKNQNKIVFQYILYIIIKSGNQISAVDYFNYQLLSSNLAISDLQKFDFPMILYPTINNEELKMKNFTFYLFFIRCLFFYSTDSLNLPKSLRYDAPSGLLLKILTFFRRMVLAKA